MKNNYIAIGLSCVLLGLLLIIRQLDTAYFIKDITVGIIFVFFGLITFFTALHKINRGIIFIAAVILLTGIILIFIKYFEILSPLDILLSSILFVIGGGVLTLFIDNPREHIFLYLSLILFALSIIAVSFQKSSIIIDYANRTAVIVYSYWPILLIFFGIIFITSRKK